MSAKTLPEKRLKPAGVEEATVGQLNVKSGITPLTQNNEGLPEGWKWVRLGDIVTVNPKIPNRDSVKDETEVQFLPMKLVEEVIGKIHLTELRRYSEVQKSYTSFIDGDVIFAKVTPCMENGKIAVVNNLKNGIGFGSSEFHVIRPDSTLNNKYLFNYIVQNRFRNEAQNEMTGAVGLRRVPKQFIENYQFPLPPLTEQHAIVSKIEELFSELDKGKQQLETAQQQLKIYRQAVLKWALEGKLTQLWRSKNKSLPTKELLIKSIVDSKKHYYDKQLLEWEKSKSNSTERVNKPSGLIEADSPNADHEKKKWEVPNNWVWTQIGQICFVTKLAGFEYTDYVKYDANGDLSVLKAENVGPSGFRYTIFSKVKSPSVRMLKRSMLSGGELLIVFVGAGTGSVSSVPTDQKYFLGPNIGMVRPILQMNSRFLEYQLRSSLGKSMLTATMKAVAQPSLSMGTIRQTPIAFPSFDEQNRIVQEIESRLSVCDKLEETINQSLAQAETLRQSILKKAFEGKLVAQAELDNVRTLTQSLSAIEDLSVAAEPVVEYKKKIKGTSIPFPKTIEGISTTDLHAGIIAMTIEAHEKHPQHLMKLSHVKGEKIAHLVEAHIGIDLGRVPKKDAAGPDDFPHLKKVESRAIKSNWFGVKKLRIGQTYVSKSGMPRILTKVKEALSKEELNRIEQLIKTFLPFELEHAEVIATVYAGWNNLLIEGKTPTDEEIVYESRENWSKRKLGIERSSFFKAIKWMKEHEYVPLGNGKLVKQPLNV